MSPAIAHLERASTLADFTSPRLLVPQLGGRDASSVIRELSLVLSQEGRVPDKAGFQAAVLQRESQASSQMEFGMALPHARLAALDELSFALGRSAEPLVWRAGETASVRLVFLIAVPANNPSRHLDVIAGLSRLSRNAPVVEQLGSAQDPGKMFDALRRVQLPSATRPAPLGDGF
jgi:mannitol/fructose-specific phosphotransferase system IIA component (Ntr-type)